MIYLIPLCLSIFFIYKYISTEYHHLVPSLVKYIFAAFTAFLLVIIITPITIKFARKVKATQKPEHPKNKMVPIPLLGGISIYSAIVLTLFSYPLPKEMISIIIGGTLILIVGTIDDIKPLPSITRLAAQVTASMIIISSGLIVSFMPDNLWGNLAAVLITLIWILGIVNATNFFDGADGLAVGFTVIACTFFFLITLHLEQYPVALITAVTAGACIGFLLFNFKPAKMYLGDGGSTFLGFLLASFALYGEWSNEGPIIALGIPTIILGVLIFDMIYITLSRVRNGNVTNIKEWLDYRGRDHFHHRLMTLGFKEEFAVIFIYITAVVLGMSVLALENAKMSFPIIILMIQSTLIFVIIIMLMLVGREK